MRVLLAALLLCAVAASVPHWAVAQSGGGDWTTPLNLSRSGAASGPALVLAPDGALRVFWWDRFDGVVVREASMPSAHEDAWSETAVVPLYEPVTVREEIVLEPVAAMPAIAGDGEGRAHAFWLGQKDEDTGQRPLLHSYLALSGRAWSYPVTVASSASLVAVEADPAGGLHLAYVRPHHTEDRPSGIYYRRLTRAGSSWGAPLLLHSSVYYRLTMPDEDPMAPELNAHLRLAVGQTGTVVVTWDDARSGQATFASSTDGGETWSEANAVGAQGTSSRQARAIAAPGGQMWLLWEDPRVQGTCALYLAQMEELLTTGQRASQRVLEGLTTCPRSERFWSLEGQGAWMVAGYGSRSLTLSLLAGSGGASADVPRWSDPLSLAFWFLDPQMARETQLESLQAAPIQTEGASGSAARLVVVGSDPYGEVWLTDASLETLRQSASQQRSAAVLPTPEADVAQKAALPGTNLSRSGAAAKPRIVVGPDGTTYAFWWDRFDGLIVAEGRVFASTVPTDTAQTISTLEVWSEPKAAAGPFPTMPHIAIDRAGRVHAFWLTEANQGAGARALMYSQWAASREAWSDPVTVAEAVAGFDLAIDASDTLHLAYLRTAHTADLPAGAYYRRSTDGGLIWEPAQPLHVSAYYRLLSSGGSSEEAYLRLAVSSQGKAYVTWDDPQRGRALWSRSDDGGQTWHPAGEIAGAPGRPWHARVILLAAGGSWLQWEDALAGGLCTLYQRPLSSATSDGSSDSEMERVLSDLASCPRDERLWEVNEQQTLMVAGRGSNALTLALWEAPRSVGAWSVPQHFAYRFEDLASGRLIQLGELDAALMDPVSGDQAAEKAFIVVGVDEAGDVWAASSPLQALDVVQGPTSAWSAAARLAQSDGLPALPAVAVDGEGVVHALWSEDPASGMSGEALYYARTQQGLGAGETWSRPARVLQSTAGAVGQPTLVAYGDRLHAVWSDGPGGEIVYSRAFLVDALSPAGWSRPRPLPAPLPVGSWPNLVADSSGVLHLVYAVPLNEGRGIYYARSEDEGESWSAESLVFDAELAGWQMADYPRLAAFGPDILHVMWMRSSLPGKGLGEGIYYAYSLDGGLSWSEALQVAEGAYAWPQVALDGEGGVHLLWQQQGGHRTWWHLYGGRQAQPVPGFAGVPGPVGWLSDRAGTLYLAGLGQDDTGQPALLFTAWDALANAWRERETLRLRPGDAAEAGVAADLEAAQGQLDVVYRAWSPEEGGQDRLALWHARRALEPVVAPPAPTPTPTPPPTATPPLPPTPTPWPTVNLDAPPPSTPTTLGPIEVPLSAFGGGLVVAALILALLIARSWWLRRR